MAYIASSAGATAAVAAAAKRRQEREEEEMTPYAPDDLNEDWEFKIVRSTFEEFGNPAKLRRLVEEEARAGWVLLEKFDNGRVRFKRPVSARERDHLLLPDIDPYRTSFSTMSVAPVVLIIAGLALALVAGIALMVIAL